MNDISVHAITVENATDEPPVNDQRIPQDLIGTRRMNDDISSTRGQWEH